MESTQPIRATTTRSTWSRAASCGRPWRKALPRPPKARRIAKSSRSWESSKLLMIASAPINLPSRSESIRRAATAPLWRAPSKPAKRFAIACVHFRRRAWSSPYRSHSRWISVRNGSPVSTVASSGTRSLSQTTTSSPSRTAWYTASRRPSSCGSSVGLKDSSRNHIGSSVHVRAYSTTIRPSRVSRNRSSSPVHGSSFGNSRPNLPNSRPSNPRPLPSPSDATPKPLSNPASKRPEARVASISSRIEELPPS